MALQFSEAMRDNRINQVEATLGTGPKLQIWSATQPANCAAVDNPSALLLCEISLPSDYLSNATGGQKTKIGAWQGTGTSAAAAGTNAGHFRMKNGAGTVCHIQGTCSAVGGGGNMELDDVSISSGQPVTVTVFTLTDGNA